MTQVGNATVTITAQTAQAQAQVQRLMTQLKTVLKPIADITPKVDTAAALADVQKYAGAATAALAGVVIKPKLKAGDILKEARSTLKTQPPLEVALKVKPVSQAAMTAALSSVTAQKEVTVNVKGDAVAKLAAIKQALIDVKTVSASVLTVNVAAVTALATKVADQIKDLRAIEQSLRTLRIPAPNTGAGAGGGSPPAGGITMSQAPRGQTSAVYAGAVAQLQALNNEYKRGDIAAAAYGTALSSLQTRLKGIQTGAAAGSRDFAILDRAITNTSQGLGRIQTDAITKIKTDLSGARAAFDAAAASAGTFAQRRAAISQYEAELGKIRTRLQQIGQSGQLSAAQLGTVQRALGQVAREGNTIRGGVNIAGLSGNVSNALRGLPALLGSVGGPLGAAAGSAVALGGGLGGIAKAAGPVGLAIGAVVTVLAGLATGLKAAIDTSAEYEQTLTDIKALTQPSIEDFNKLKAATFDIGKPLGVGARAAAGAVLELNKAGLSTTDTLKGGLKGALDLAGAAGVQTAEAAQIAVSAMTAFGLAGKDLPGVADVFTNFANKTFLGATDLSLAIAAVGPVARSAGIDLGQFSGIMATLAQGGFKNMSDAGTSLKTMLLSLQAPTDTGKKFIKALGVDVFDASGKMKPLTETIGAMREKLVKLTPEAQKKIMKEIFGQDAIRAAEILLRVGPKALDQNSAAMRRQGEAARVAKERLQSLQGANKQFAAVMEEVRIKIGTPFLGALAGIVRGATSAVQSLLNIAGGAGRAGLAFTQMRAAVETNFSAVGNIVRAVFGDISKTYNNVLKPILDVLGQVWSVVYTAAATAFGLLSNLVAGVFRAVRGVVSGFVSAFTGDTKGVAVNLNSLSDRFRDWAEVARAYIVAVGKVGGALPQAFGIAGQRIGLIIGGIGKVLAGFGLVAYDYLVKPVLPVLKVLGDAFGNVGRFIGDNVSALIKFVGERLQPIIGIFKSLGVGVGEVLEKGLKSLTGFVGGVVDKITQKSYQEALTQQGAAAAAAEGNAKKASGGFTLMKEGVDDVSEGVKGLKDVVGDFGKLATTTFGNIPTQLAAARAEAARLQKDLTQTPNPATGAATVPDKLESGTGTLEDLGLGPKAKKKPVTVDDINALEAYRQKLKGLNAEQLRAEVSLQTQRKDKERLRIAIAALNAELGRQATATRRATAEDKRAAEQRAALVIRIRQSLQDFNLLAQQGRVTMQSRLNFVQQFQRFQAEANKLPAAQRETLRGLFDQAQAITNSVSGQVRLNEARRQGGITDARAAELRANLVRETRQAIATLKQLTDGGKANEAQVLSQRQKFEDLTATMNKLPEASRKGLAPLFQQAKALLGVAAAQASLNKVKAADAKRTETQGKADTLTRQINNLAQSFGIQAEAGKTTEASLASYGQRLTELGEKVKALPPEFQASGLAALDAARQLATFGQGVVNRNAEINKLKDAVSGMSFEELTSAIDRVNASGGDAEKLAILQTEIDKRKTLSAATLAQAEAEGQLSQARADLAGTESAYDLDIGKAEGSLSKLYALEVSYGTRIQGQRDAVARADGVVNERQIRKRYDDLFKLEGISVNDRARLDAALTAELQANSDAVAATVAGNAARKVAAEVKAKQALDAALLSVDRSTRQTMTAQALSAAQRETARIEAEQAEALNAEDLTAAQTLAIRLKYQPLLIAAKKREVAQERQISEAAEADRYSDAVDAAKAQGTLDTVIARTGLTVRETLEREHQAVLLGIRNSGEDAARDYALGVKRETGKAIIADNKAVEKQRLDDAKGRIDKELETLDTMDAAGRAQAVKLFEDLIGIYKSMLGPALSGPAIAALQDAINKVKGQTTKVEGEAEKLVLPGDTSGLAARALQDRQAIGKPDGRAEAEAQAKSRYDSLIDGYQKKIDELQLKIRDFDGIPAEKLTPKQAELLAGLRRSLGIYQGFLSDATTDADAAGTSAGQAYSSALSDQTQEGMEALLDAERELAQAEGRSGGPAYLAGLNSAVAYWKARKLGLDAGSADYLKAVKKITDLEGKIRAEQGQQLSLSGLGKNFKMGQAEGVGQFNSAVSSMTQSLGGALSPLGIFASILEKINPAGMILEGIFSVLEEPIKALQEPFKTIGTLIGSVIAPVLELLAPILEGVAQIFTVLYDAIAAFIKTISFGLINIDRRTPDDGKEKETPEERDAKDVSLESDAELAELDNLLAKKLISEGEYETRKLKLTTDRINRERAVELAAAEGNERRILAINRKYDAQIEKERIDAAARLSAAFTAIGDSLAGSISSSVKDGLMGALKARNFGSFRASFAKNLKAAMFDAVLSAAIETAAFKAILQPAIDALTDAFVDGSQGDIDKAIQGVIKAGDQVVTKARGIYTALRPLRDAWGISEDGEMSQSQTVEVTGSVSAPVLTVSLDMLAYLADAIKTTLPTLEGVLAAHTSALIAHTAALGGAAPAQALSLPTASLPVQATPLPGFVEAVGGFRQMVLTNVETGNVIRDSVDRLSKTVDRMGEITATHNAAMLKHAQALSSGSSSTFSSKR